MMNITLNSWKKLFLFCFGIAFGASFCMKWMEGDFIINAEKFTIIGLEISYPKEKVMAILAGSDLRVRTILGYHLAFDFIFMAGVYPAVASLCIMAREKFDSSSLRRIAYSLAALQVVAWGCDIGENSYLLKWLDNPVIDDSFVTYHVVVAVKWILVTAGILFSLSILAFKKKAISR
jgi:hypothetical protein